MTGEHVADAAADPAMLFMSGMSRLDAIDRHLIDLLQHDDQASLGELGHAVGLAPSSVKERIRRLRDQGAITGFHAHIAPEALGLDLLAFMFVGWLDPAAEAPFLKRALAHPGVLECHHVTGAWNYLLKLRLPNTRELERFLNEVIKQVPGIQRTETLIALSSAKETTTVPGVVDELAGAKSPPTQRKRR